MKTGYQACHFQYPAGNRLQEKPETGYKKGRMIRPDIRYIPNHYMIPGTPWLGLTGRAWEAGVGPGLILPDVPAPYSNVVFIKIGTLCCRPYLTFGIAHAHIPVGLRRRGGNSAVDLSLFVLLYSAIFMNNLKLMIFSNKKRTIIHWLYTFVSIYKIKPPFQSEVRLVNLVRGSESFVQRVMNYIESKAFPHPPLPSSLNLGSFGQHQSSVGSTGN